MNISQLAAVIGIGLVIGSVTPVIAAQHGSIDKVMGSASVNSDEHYSDISLVNGSLTMASNSSAKNVSLVNGSIELGDNVQILSAATVNGSIETGTGLKVAGDLTTVNGRVEPGSQAVIDGSIATVNGDIELESGEVGKDISTVNGDITLTGNTRVKGDIVYKPRGKRKMFFGWINNEKPVLRIAANAVVEGNIILQQEVELQLENATLQEKVIYQINDGR